jgi:hypothetical protein
VLLKQIKLDGTVVETRVSQKAGAGKIMDPGKQQTEDARRVLYNLDPDDGSIVSKSKLYQLYEKNAADYARAKSDYAAAYAKACSDPATLQQWPLTASTYQQAVDRAWNTWTSAGKNKIERALNTLASDS